ncbi:MAG: acyl-CoA dehydrogenase family protein [bacterium]|nr:acyl-CoA dehydrogenase family protein [bacterium]
MKLRFDASVEAFRAEFLEWLEQNRPSADELAAEPARSSAHLPSWARGWAQRLFDAGWLIPGWPPELGGRNAGAVETLVYLEELNRHNIPRTTNPQGVGIIAPSLIDYGTQEQIDSYAIPVLRGELSACLGMSEPDAGSDLASLKTRAVFDGDSIVLNGQKVWTSGAHDADFCFMFCRTDPDVPKHRGISIVLVPMDTPGLTVRPLKEIIHPHLPDLNEVFLDDVMVPAENLVGELNNGWRMANGALAHERNLVWLMAVLGNESAFANLLEMLPQLLQDCTLSEQTSAIDDLVGLHVDTVAARCLGYRGFARYTKGGTAPEQALMKVYTSEIRQRLALFAAELAGPASLKPSAKRHTDVGTLEDFYSTFASTISAGSSEIQRNIIAEKVLSLPRS